MHTFIWIVQAALAAFFFMPGGMKVITPREKMIEKGQLKPGDSIIPIRALGIVELLGIIGLILPSWLNIVPILTPIAAIGFCIVMVGAFVVHFRKKDFRILPLLVAIFILSALVVWYRF